MEDDRIGVSGRAWVNKDWECRCMRLYVSRQDNIRRENRAGVKRWKAIVRS